MSAARRAASSAVNRGALWTVVTAPLSRRFSHDRPALHHEGDAPDCRARGDAAAFHVTRRPMPTCRIRSLLVRGVAALLFAAGLFASFWPALRAARVDPMTALRE